MIDIFKKFNRNVYFKDYDPEAKEVFTTIANYMLNPYACELGRWKKGLGNSLECNYSVVDPSVLDCSTEREAIRKGLAWIRGAIRRVKSCNSLVKKLGCSLIARPNPEGDGLFVVVERGKTVILDFRIYFVKDWRGIYVIKQSFSFESCFTRSTNTAKLPTAKFLWSKHGKLASQKLSDFGLQVLEYVLQSNKDCATFDYTISTYTFTFSDLKDWKSYYKQYDNLIRKLVKVYGLTRFERDIAPRRDDITISHWIKDNSIYRDLVITIEMDIKNNSVTFGFSHF